jgi:hypothetical protein
MATNHGTVCANSCPTKQKYAVSSVGIPSKKGNNPNKRAFLMLFPVINGQKRKMIFCRKKWINSAPKTG